jgi:hypothetical protein
LYFATEHVVSVFELLTCILEALGANSGEAKAFIIIIIIIIIIINCEWVYTRWQWLQCKTGHYNTVQYNIVQLHTSHKTYNIQGNPLYAKLKKNHKHALYTIKTQKRLEPKVGESVLKATWLTNLTVL